MGLIDFRKIVGEIENLVARVALPDEVRDALAVARELLERGNAAEAARVVEPLVDKFPKLSEPCVFLGLARERDGAMAAAAEAFERALKRGARPEEVLPALGRARESLGDLKGAEDAYHEAARFSGDDVEVQLGLARVALWAGAWERAAAILKRCDGARSDVALLAVVADFRLALYDAAIRRARAVEVASAELACWEGRAHLARGDFGEAVRAFQRVAEDRESRRESHVGAAALLGEARALVALGRRNEAEACARRARALEPCRETLALVAELAEPTVALALWEEALSLPLSTRAPWDSMPSGRDAADLHVAAAEAALTLGDFEKAVAHVESAKRLGATEKVTLFIEARLAEQSHDDKAAYEKWTRHFDVTGEPSALIAAGSAAWRAKRWDEAKAALDRAAALAPTAPNLRDALARLYESASPAVEDALDAACRRFRDIASRAGDAAIAESAAVLATELGRPLTLAVMGEFSAGKSTFVNALLGAEVLPVGVTPTTATVNVIRYGAERAARVVRVDGRIEPIAWGDLAAAIDRRLGADPRAIREVEIDWPALELRDVSILDTPGFNAVAEGHEGRAAELLQRADAVVWLFDAGQAGRASEAEQLERLAALGVRVLGVLNKADRLAPCDVEKVLELLRRVAPSVVSTVLPCSAKLALAARGTGTDADLTATGFPALRTTLDEQFFSKARELKRDVVERRVMGAARGLRAQVIARRVALEARRQRVADVEAEVAEVGATLDVELRDGLLAELRAALSRTLREVAREVVRFVEPANAFRGARIRDDGQAIAAASFATLALSAVDATVVFARATLDRAFARADSAWRALLPPDTGELLTRYGETVRELFVAKTVERYRAELFGLTEGPPALALLKAAVDDSKGEADALASALLAALPPLGGGLREALKVGIDGVRAALVVPAAGLR
ncbi:MAG: dynamin family protein, partial [Deltaproteobacteria bacterium]|nr:dynamin family protein [Deltaproteobacteria bacterium]